PPNQPNLRVIQGEGSAAGDRPVSAATKQNAPQQVQPGSTSVNPAGATGAGATVSPLERGRGIARRLGVNVERAPMSALENEAATAYMEASGNPNNPGAAGKAFHDKLRAAPQGGDARYPRSASQWNRGRPVEYKTVAPTGVVTDDIVADAFKQAAAYGPRPVVIVYEFSTGTKFIFSKYPILP